jgi:hypothetical protein
MLKAVMNGRITAGPSDRTHHGPLPASAARVAIVLALGGAFAGCDVNAALARLSEARQLAADLRVQFAASVDAGDRAVMADTDAASVAFAQEDEKAIDTAQQDADALAPILQQLGYSKEAGLLRQFRAQFDAYRGLDRTIRDLAVENTNLKAQQLSFTAARDAADALRDALDRVAPSKPADAWHVKALAAQALAATRDIQALQAPHIAEPDEQMMARLEARMASSEEAAHRALDELTDLVQPASRPQVAAAHAALDRLMNVNAQIVTLSRRNSNVRSLALSLNEKRKLTTACEQSLGRLLDALAARGFTGIR